MQLTEKIDPRTELRSEARPAAAALPEEVLRTATRLRLALGARERSIAFTGIVTADRASELAWDMAAAFDRFAPGQVLLVEADPSRPTPDGPGLAEVLSGECALHAALREPHGDGPWLLHAGRMPAERSTLFSSPECEGLLETLEEKFSHVLVDAGPLSSPASLMLIARCRTVVAALAAGAHGRGEILALKSELARLKSRMLGVVLTGEKR